MHSRPLTLEYMDFLYVEVLQPRAGLVQRYKVEIERVAQQRRQSGPRPLVAQRARNEVQPRHTAIGAVIGAWCW